MTSPAVQLYRMKPHCVVGGVPWWKEGGVYSGSVGTGEVGTVQLLAPHGGDTLEVLRGSVVRVNEFAIEQ